MITTVYYLNYDMEFLSMFVLGGITTRRRVAVYIWPYMLSIGLAYFVTLCLFPGIESEVLSCKLQSWMPVILIAIFNVFDFIGKVGCNIINANINYSLNINN